MADADITPYLNRIPSEHRQRPNFIATISIGLQAMANLRAVADSLPGLFDLDTAVGEQLDFTGEWIGVSRDVTIPGNHIGFTWDTPGQGWDNAAWGGSSTGDKTIVLNDKNYRVVLYARVVANQWDGTIPGAYTAWDTMFEPLGYSIKIYDGSSLEGLFAWDVPGQGWDQGVWSQGGTLVMTMRLELDGISEPPPALIKALLEGGYLDLKPAGVQISGYLIDGAPI